MRVYRILAGAMLLLTTPVLGQVRTKAEVGTALGVTISTPDNGKTVTTVGVPGAGSFAGISTLYVSLFASPSVVVEPQINFQLASSGGNTVTSFSGIVQLAYLVSGADRGSVYVAAHGGLFSLSDGRSTSSGAIGGGLGYRMQIGTGAALRLEGRYRRWLGADFKINEISFSVGLGSLFR